MQPRLRPRARPSRVNRDRSDPYPTISGRCPPRSPRVHLLSSADLRASATNLEECRPRCGMTIHFAPHLLSPLEEAFDPRIAKHSADNLAHASKLPRVRSVRHRSSGKPVGHETRAAQTSSPRCSSTHSRGGHVLTLGDATALRRLHRAGYALTAAPSHRSSRRCSRSRSRASGWVPRRLRPPSRRSRHVRAVSSAASDT